MATLERQTDKDVRATVIAWSPEELTAIQLLGGEWIPVRSTEYVHFAVAPKFSPATPTKLYGALRYQDDEGRECITPLSQVQSFSTTRKESFGR